LTALGGDAPHDALAEAKKWAGHPANRQLLWKEWERLRSLEDSGVFFEELGHKIPATLGMRLRICIAQAMVGYCYSVKRSQWADPNLMREAKRLVKLTHGLVDKLSKRLRNYDPKVRSVSEFSVGLHRECLEVYQDAKQRQKQLTSLSEQLTGEPDERLAEATSAMFEALCKIEPPFWAVDCEAALSILDKLLVSWGDATGSTKGQDQRDKALNDLVTHLRQVFADATGKPPNAAHRYMPFLKRILAALPPGMYREGAEETLRTQVKRLRRKSRTSAVI
jgi:hypothetical protein